MTSPFFRKNETFLFYSPFKILYNVSFWLIKQSVKKHRTASKRGGCFVLQQVKHALAKCLHFFSFEMKLSSGLLRFNCVFGFKIEKVN
jgi:hypothetical protein